MNNFLNTPYFSAMITLIGYWIGVEVKKRFNHPLASPLIVGSVFVSVVLKTLQLDISNYQSNSYLISFFLNPATLCLAIILYKQMDLFLSHKAAILIGTFAGVVVNVVLVVGLSLLFKLTEGQVISFIPKSVTVAIGLSITESFGGIAPITMFAIIVTGVFGNLIAEHLLKLAKITDPVARGIAIGSSAHILGTSKALELGETEGAMSGLSIVITGLMTLVVMILINPLLVSLF